MVCCEDFEKVGAETRPLGPKKFFFFIFSIFFTQPHQIRLFSRVLRSLFDFVFAQRFPKSLPKGSLNLFFYVSTLSGHCDIMWRLVEQVQHKAKSSDWS